MSQSQSQAQSQAQSQSTSIPDAQPDPFREFFRPDSLSNSSSPEIPDSQDSQPISEDSTYARATSRDDRIAIQTALKFKISHARIREVLGVTENQIQYARSHRITPQKSKTGRKPLFHTPQRRHLEQWLLESPSHRRIPYQYIPRYIDIPEFEGVGEKAIKTAFQLLGYCRRTSKKKGFSDDPAVKQERLIFSRQAILWTRSRVKIQIFSDEVWAMGGAHTTSYVTVKEDGSDRFLPENLQHKYSKAPAWMFHGSIVGGRKGPGIFWEKEWGNINSASYDLHILSRIQIFMEENPGLIFMQDNAPAHRSKLTARNLRRRQISYIKQPRYSPDLNLIEHVWNWMKNWIQEHYWQIRYNVSGISLDQLRQIIWAAWEAVPDSYIESLVDSWWDRCQAVIDANGGPTKY
jgi:hypothetical protein